MSAKRFSDRRLRLADLLPGIPVLLHSGVPKVRNYPAYSYPFRASSHYLYFGAPNVPHHALMLLNGEATLYKTPQDEADKVWHGETVSDETLINEYELQTVKDFTELVDDIATLGLDEVLALPAPDGSTDDFLKGFLNRVPSLEEDPDIDLVYAVVEMRLRHDEPAIAQLREAARETVEMQKTLAQACRPGVSERELKAVFDQQMTARGLFPSFQPILSVAGEVLHNPYYNNTLSAGDLLLVDCGAEIATGWAGDLTRVYPVSGTFSPTQKAIYDIVDRARARAIEMVEPGAHFKDLHLAAARVILEGLTELNYFQGSVDEMLEAGAQALVFPHGLGHLVGLDVHDMEDLGDLPGYEDGEERDPQFGLSNLRLSRELEAGMVVTIEPGFYQIPQLLNGPLGREMERFLNRDEMAKYADVRGIRLEDMVLVTEEGYEVLSCDLPVASDEVEKLLS